MGAGLYIIASVIKITFYVVYFASFLRVFLPFLCDTGTNKIYLFVCLITEPFVIPVRVILQKFNILQGSPIDWAFIITFMLLGIVVDISIIF